MINHSLCQFNVFVGPALLSDQLGNYFSEELVDCAFFFWQSARFIASNTVVLQFVDQVVEGDTPVLLKIALIAHQESKHIWVIAVLIDIVHVLVYRFERVWTIHRVNNNDCMRASVKVARNRLKIISSCRIPNIQLYL